MRRTPEEAELDELTSPWISVFAVEQMKRKQIPIKTLRFKCWKCKHKLVEKSWGLYCEICETPRKFFDFTYNRKSKK